MPAGPAKIGQLSSEVVTGCAIKKGESDPAIKPDAEYPAWLFELMTPEPTVAELERMYASEGLTLAQVCVGLSVSDFGSSCSSVSVAAADVTQSIVTGGSCTSRISLP